LLNFKYEVHIGGLSLSKKTTDFIICCLWALFLFGLWVIVSFFKGTEGEWWSIYNLNPEKPSPWALEFSYFKIFIAVSLSVITAFFLTKWIGESKT
jgi:hypothetical protein